MSPEEMACALRTSFPSWYWRVFTFSTQAVLKAPTRLQKGLWRVFLSTWVIPVDLRAKRLWRAHG